MRYQLPVPGTDLFLTYERDPDGRLLELRCRDTVHAHRDGEELTLGPGLARVGTAAVPDGFDRTVVAAGTRWTERYRWDTDGQLAHVDGVAIRRDPHGRVVACLDESSGTAWRYGYAGRDLVVVDAPAQTRHLTVDAAGRTVLVRTAAGRVAVQANPGRPPPTWHRDDLGRLWTVTDADGRVRATYLWDGFACLGRIAGGGPDRPLSTVYSLDPSGTPVRLIGRRHAVRVPRDAFGEALLRHRDVPGLFGGAVHSGRVHLGLRAVDPRLGRFTTPDPFDGGWDDPRRAGGEARPLPVETAHAGPYAVCRHDPVGRTDPLGGISWWLPLSDITWSLQNNIVSLLGMDFTVNLWGSLVGGIVDHSLPGRFASFTGVSSSDRVGSYGILRDGWLRNFQSNRAFTYAHTMFAHRDHVAEQKQAQVFVPADAFTPTCYGSVLRLEPAGEPPVLLRGDAVLGAGGPLTWSRSGETAVAALPGSTVPAFPKGGLHFARQEKLTTGLAGQVSELVPTGRPVVATFGADNAVIPIAPVSAPGTVAARVERFGAGVLNLADLAAAGTSVTVGTVTVNGPTVTGLGPPAAAPGPGQAVLVSPAAGAPEAAVVSRVTVRCRFDRAVPAVLTQPMELTVLGKPGAAYDATPLPGNRVTVQPMVAGTRVQFPRFQAGELVEVAWTGPTAKTDRFAIGAVDGTTLTLTDGKGTVPANATGVTVTRLVPVAATDAASKPTGGVRVGRAGIRPAGAPATDVDLDVWQATAATGWVAGPTPLALSDGSTARPVVLANVPSWTVTLAAAPTLQGAGLKLIVPAPTRTGFFATADTTATVTLADPMPATPALDTGFVLVTGFAPGGAGTVDGGLSSGGGRVPQADEDFEIDKFQGLLDHELTHTKQTVRLGPWLLAFFPMAFFELGRLVHAIEGFDLPDYSAFVTGTVAADKPGRRVLTLDNPPAGTYRSGDRVQVWSGSGQPTVVTLGEAEGDNRFVVNVSGIGPDGHVNVRKVTNPGGAGGAVGFAYQTLNLFTHGGAMNFVAGTAWGGLFWLFGEAFYGIYRAINDTRCQATVEDTGMTVRLQPGGDDKAKAETLRAFKGVKQVVIRQDKTSLLRELADANPPALKLKTAVSLTGIVSVSPDATSGSLFDWYDYFPVSVPDPSKPATLKVEQAGGKTLELHPHDRVKVEFADAVDANHRNLLTTYVTNVTAGGMVELQDPPFVGGQQVTPGRIARINEGDPMGWADSWVMERLGMGWMRWLFDPYGQLTVRLHQERNSPTEIILRVGRYIFGSKSWSLLPALGYFEWDNARKQPDEGHLSNMEQEASQESGDNYSAIGRLRVGVASVGDVGRYWYFTPSRDDSLPNGTQDEPGVRLRPIPCVMPLVTPETTAAPRFNRGASSPVASPGPTPQAPGDPGGSVADAFVAKGPDASEPAPPIRLDRAYLANDRGWIPLNGRTARSSGIHVAFSRPGRHRITLTDGFGDDKDSRQAQDEGKQTVFYDVTVADVAVTLGGFQVAEGATITLVATQRAALTVTAPDGAPREHVLTVTRPTDGPVRTTPDGKTLVAGPAAVAAAQPVEASRLYRPDPTGIYTEGGLAGRTVHLANLAGDVHVPVRSFAVTVTTQLTIRSAPAIDPADPNANAVATVAPGGEVFVVVPAAACGPLTIGPLPPGITPTVDPVTPDAALQPFVGDGGVFHVTFDAGQVPPAPVDLTVRIDTWVPEPGKTCADPGVVKTTLTGALQLTL
jgi:hypothetical protein